MDNNTFLNKAMTQEEKLEKAKELYPTANADQRYVLECLFPELKESEDERIRKELINHCKDKASKYSNDPKYKNINAWIAWLEKQGESYTKKDVDDAYLKGVCDAKSELEKQGENKQILANSAKTFKVEPRFHEGEWVIDKQDIVHQIANVIENVTYHTYGYDIVGGGYFKDNTEGVRLWTIQDAKDGDVLVSQYDKPFIYNGNYSSFRIGSYCGIAIDDKFIVATEKCNWTDNVNIHPATKEQRNTLFAKMKDAGYEWNADKKEVRKIDTSDDADEDIVRVVGI